MSKYYKILHNYIYIYYIFKLNYHFFYLDIYPNELIIFVCMLKDQAKLIHKLESIQIDLTFKRVKGNINEFEINSYNSKHKLSKFFFLFLNFYLKILFILIFLLI